MKNYIYSIFCLLFFSCGQTQNNQDQARQTDAVISADTVVAAPNPISIPTIKEAYASITNKLQSGSLDSVSYAYDCNGERSGTVTYFSDKGKLAVIKHNYSEYSHFSAVKQYFVARDSLFFLQSKEVVWSFESAQAVEGATKDDITEKRFYIAKDKALLCLEKKYSKRSKSDDGSDPNKIANKEVECKSIESAIKDYGKLLAFKESANRDCLGK